MYKVYVAYPDDYKKDSDRPVGRCIGSFKSYREAADKLFSETIKDVFGRKSKEVYIVHNGRVIA